MFRLRAKVGLLWTLLAYVLFSIQGLLKWCQLCRGGKPQTLVCVQSILILVFLMVGRPDNANFLLNDVSYVNTWIEGRLLFLRLKVCESDMIAEKSSCFLLVILAEDGTGEAFRHWVYNCGLKVCELQLMLESELILIWFIWNNYFIIGVRLRVLILFLLVSRKRKIAFYCLKRSRSHEVHYSFGVLLIFILQSPLSLLHFNRLHSAFILNCLWVMHSFVIIINNLSWKCWYSLKLKVFWRLELIFLLCN